MASILPTFETMSAWTGFACAHGTRREIAVREPSLPLTFDCLFCFAGKVKEVTSGDPGNRKKSTRRRESGRYAER